MSIAYGKDSRRVIQELHGFLQRLVWRCSDSAPESLDLKLVDGFRGEAEQNKAFAEGHSKHEWPNSAHNKKPARAFDFTPYPFKGWDDEASFWVIQGALRLVAAQQGIKLKPPISWDAGHVELEDGDD